MTNDDPPPGRPAMPETPSDPSTPSSMPRNTPMSGSSPPKSSATSAPAPPSSPPRPAASQGDPGSTAPGRPGEDFSKLPFPLQDGERVLGIRRRHWIFLWPTILFYALVAIAPVLLLRWLLDIAGILDDIDPVFWIIAAIWLIFWGIRVALIYYRFRNDIWVITSQRLIDCRRRHPFDLTVATADLVNVQDMSVARNGILATMLDYGDIVCQTASVDAHDFKLSGIPNPRETQILVDRERDRERMRARGV